jgi:ribA/ribD-fused uncharacterized protein
MTTEPILGFFDEYRFLSNFWYAAQEIDGTWYPYNEMWYMTNKTVDPEERASIFGANSPQAAKQIGRIVTLRPDWEHIKDWVMLVGLRAKFQQNPDLAVKLVATGKRYLEETNKWNDTYWGVCNGIGRNMLGILLMQVRAELS